MSQFQHWSAKPVLKLGQEWVHLTVYADVITYPCPNLDVGLFNLSEKRQETFQCNNSIHYYAMCVVNKIDVVDW